MKVKRNRRRIDPKQNSLNQDTVEAVAAAARATALSGQSGQQNNTVDLKATRTKPRNTRAARHSKQHETALPQPVPSGEDARAASTGTTSSEKAQPDQDAVESLLVDSSKSSLDGGRSEHRMQEKIDEDGRLGHTHEFEYDSSGSSVGGATLSETPTVPGDNAPDRLLSERLEGCLLYTSDAADE